MDDDFLNGFDDGEGLLDFITLQIEHAGSYTVAVKELVSGKCIYRRSTNDAEYLPRFINEAESAKEAYQDQLTEALT